MSLKGGEEPRASGFLISIDRGRWEDWVWRGTFDLHQDGKFGLLKLDRNLAWANFLELGKHGSRTLRLRSLERACVLLEDTCSALNSSADGLPAGQLPTTISPRMSASASYVYRFNANVTIDAVTRSFVRSRDSTDWFVRSGVQARSEFFEARSGEMTESRAGTPQIWAATFGSPDADEARFTTSRSPSM